MTSIYQGLVMFLSCHIKLLLVHFWMCCKHQIKAIGQVAGCYAIDLSLAVANAFDTLARLFFTCL